MRISWRVSLLTRAYLLTCRSNWAKFRVNTEWQSQEQSQHMEETKDESSCNRTWQLSRCKPIYYQRSKTNSNCKSLIFRTIKTTKWGLSRQKVKASNRDWSRILRRLPKLQRSNRSNTTISLNSKILSSLAISTSQIYWSNIHKRLCPYVLRE